MVKFRILRCRAEALQPTLTGRRPRTSSSRPSTYLAVSHCCHFVIIDLRVDVLANCCCSAGSATVLQNKKNILRQHSDTRTATAKQNFNNHRQGGWNESDGVELGTQAGVIPDPGLRFIIDTFKTRVTLHARSTEQRLAALASRFVSCCLCVLGVVVVVVVSSWFPCVVSSYCFACDCRNHNPWCCK